MARIKFPEPYDLVKKMLLKVHYYDLTWSDFNNEEFRDELAAKNVFEKGSIEHLVKLEDAFTAKKNEKSKAEEISNAK